jgi:CO/xanthine dehydrogenase FAD-binding subunit
MRPQGVAIAILNLAVWLERHEDIIADVRIALGPAGPRPLRARRTEDTLRGKPFSRQAIEQALQCLLEEAQFRTSRHRATQEYRYHLAGILLEETMTTAWRRAIEKGW